MAQNNYSFAFAEHLIKIPSDQLVMGMYVYELDCDWSRTPFESDGFLLQKKEDRDLLTVLCKKVTIDIKRGVAPPERKAVTNDRGIEAPSKAIFGIDTAYWSKQAKKLANTPITLSPKRSRPTNAPSQKTARTSEARAAKANKPQTKTASPGKPRNLTILSNARSAAPDATRIKINRDRYRTTQSMKKGIDKALWNYRKLQRTFQLVCWQIRRRGVLNVQLLQNPIASTIAHILQNPQIYIWLLNTEDKAKTKTTYCVRAAIWAAILARQFGFSRPNIEVLFMGTLLCDVGLNLLPTQLVNKRGPFKRPDYQNYQKHVGLGLKLLAQSPELDERITQIVRFHHERQDGRGFPRGSSGKQIPPMARFANLAYCFERLLRSNYPQRKVSPIKAINRLYTKRALNFSEQMILEFIHALGTYPVGTLVELSTRELALVVEQNPKARLYPKVALLYADNGARIDEPVLIDLALQGGAGAGRSISANAKLVPEDLDLSDFTLRFWGKQLGVGPFSLRL